jgi:hypothetical protein
MSLKKKQIRTQWRLAVFERDFCQCKKCHPKATRKPQAFCYGDFDAHHIVDRNEMPNGGYILSNGITLCHPCHLKAEKFHQTNGREWEAGYHPRRFKKAHFLAICGCRSTDRTTFF